MKCKVFLLIASLTVLLTTSCTTSCDNNKRKCHYEDYGLNCPVKSIKVTTYEAKSKFGDVVKDDLAQDGHYQATFNAVGNLEAFYSYDDNGDLVSVEKYKYDKDENVVEFSTYDNEGALMYSLQFEYVDDKISSYVQKSYWNDEEERRTYNHKWDGGYIVETDLLVNGELFSKTKNTNTSKNKREWVLYDKNGEEISRGYEEYNDFGGIVKHDDGNLHFEVQWNNKNLPIHLKNAHLHNNTMISWNGNEEGCEYYVEYEYDRKGNWIKQTVYEDEIKKPLTISERIITY